MIWEKSPREYSYQWHPWYAWHPVTIDKSRVWLEVIERRRFPDAYPLIWDYRRMFN